MYGKDHIEVPRVEVTRKNSSALEWEIPDKISVAFAYIEKSGYTFMAKVKVKKKFWWSRSWNTFIVHAPTAEEALEKGLEHLASYGFTIECDLDEIRDSLRIRTESTESSKDTHRY